ncbi:MAG: TadE/TadG family type IV pilus assembly protein [Pseudomonadota bacterium]
MWAADHALPLRRPNRSRQRGATAVEVGLLLFLFFLVVFSTLELARLMYVYNTLQEVTRRAAHELANTPPADPNSPSIVDVRRRAIFQKTGDNLVLASPVTIDHVRVDYQSLVRDPSDGTLRRVATSPLPASAAANRQICMADPNNEGCVRFVRVRICDPDDAATCNKVDYEPAFPLVPLALKLPTSSTIAPAESLGYEGGMTPLP